MQSLWAQVAGCNGTRAALATATPSVRSGGASTTRALGRHSVWIAWAAGAIYSLPGAEYLAGLVLLAKVGAPTASEVLAVLGFNLIMFAAIELPLLGFVLAPERTRSLTEKLNRWMTDHRQILIVIVTGAVGIYLLVSGFGDLG